MLIIRSPYADELSSLSDLCFRSKAVWGYDEAFMAACRKELSFDLTSLEQNHIAVAEFDGKVLGVVEVRLGSGETELLKLFVEPMSIRKGTGRRLFAWAVEVSEQLGASRMVIEADPDAAPFYRKLGARDAGKVPSNSIPGRSLPRLTFDV